MKKLIIAAVFALSTTAFSQQNKDQLKDVEKKSPAERVEKQLQKMTADLNLDDKQVVVVRELLTNQATKRQEKFDSYKQQKEAQAKISRDDRKLLGAEMKQNQAELKERMKAVLNADQYAKWEKNREEQRVKMIEKIKERRATK